MFVDNIWSYILAKKLSYYDFLTGSHELYQRYYEDWNLALKSYYGGVEYRRGKYLKCYDIDQSTPSEVITTYDVDANGVQTGSYSTMVERVGSKTESESGSSYLSSFYEEKLRNVPVFPYTRLYVSEYNSILFRNPPHREMPDTPDVLAFSQDCDGEGNSLNEFWSQVDTFSTVCGVVWVSCIKPAEKNYALLRMYKPQDVTNWEYSYTTSGELVLNRIVLRVSTNPGVDIYHYITKETIDTVFVITDDEVDVVLPDGGIMYSEDELNYYRISQPNELGYIPVRPVYQSSKIYNGIGHTPIFDIAQIQRSVYGDMGEIYSAVSYGSHPVNIVDEQTAQLNNGAIGAEPGTVIRVASSLNGQTNHVYEFVAPPLDSLQQLRELIDQKIEKMNQVAMVRSDELIRASRSGVQIEQYDSKLEAFIRKKATSLENAEFQLWEMWYDWQNKPIPTDLTISYNRQYNKKGLEEEIAELTNLMALYDAYKARFEGVPMEEESLEHELHMALEARIKALVNNSYTENSL